MNISKKHIELKSGTLLVSDPFSQDFSFKKSVVLLCEHNEKGSFGFIINKLTDLKLGELISGFESIDAPVFYGGPVQTDTMHFIHRLGDLIPGAKYLAPNVWWGGDFETLKVLIRAGSADINDVRFFIGYSGWDIAQLNDEYHNQHSWVIAKANEQFCFHDEFFQLWNEVLKSMGGNYAIIADLPDETILN
jgi:putative transcriptional regulator